MTAPHPAETTTPVSNRRVTDHLPNLLAIPNTRKIENSAPANAALFNQKLFKPNRIADRAPTAEPPEMPRIYGSASGFRNNTCIITPDNASNPPVVNAARGSDEITWWENDGNENFTEHTIDDDFDGAYDVYATDLDSDGDVDILGAAAGNIGFGDQKLSRSSSKPS